METSTTIDGTCKPLGVPENTQNRNRSINGKSDSHQRCMAGIGRSHSRQRASLGNSQPPPDGIGPVRAVASRRRGAACRRGGEGDRSQETGFGRRRPGARGTNRHARVDGGPFRLRTQWATRANPPERIPSAPAESFQANVHRSGTRTFPGPCRNEIATLRANVSQMRQHLADRSPTSSTPTIPACPSSTLPATMRCWNEDPIPCGQPQPSGVNPAPVHGSARVRPRPVDP